MLEVCAALEWQNSKERALLCQSSQRQVLIATTINRPKNNSYNKWSRQMTFSEMLTEISESTPQQTLQHDDLCPD